MDSGMAMVEVGSRVHLLADGVRQLLSQRSVISALLGSLIELFEDAARRLRTGEYGSFARLNAYTVLCPIALSLDFIEVVVLCVEQQPVSFSAGYFFDHSRNLQALFEIDAFKLLQCPASIDGDGYQLGLLSRESR